MKRKSVLRWCLVAALATVGSVVGPAWAEQKVFEVDNEFYPYYPSLIKWNKSSAEFTKAETCGGCHPQQYEEWTGSVHASFV